MNAKCRSPRAPIPVARLEQVASMLRLLAHPQRLRVVECLERMGEAPVFAITGSLGLAPAAVSQHLNQMKRVGLVRSARRGKQVWYEIADPRALTILGCIRKQGGQA